MPIAKRGNSYLMTVNDKRLPDRRLRVSFKTEAEAKAYELKVRAALENNETIPSAKPGAGKQGTPYTLEQLYNLTYDRYWKNSGGEKELKSHARIVLRTIGETVAPKDVDETTIDAMIQVFEDQGLSDNTINRRLSVISKMLGFALDRGFIHRKPKIERKPEGEHRVRYFSQDEEEELIAYFRFIGCHDLADMVTVAVDTGLRKGELKKITDKDCNFEENLIQLPGNITKTRKPRDVPMTKRVTEILKRYTQEKGVVFKGWPDSTIQKYWNKGRKHMGMMDDPQFVFHALRHTFCSRLVQRGIQLQVVAKLAGHRDLKTTLRYAHLAPSNLRSAIDVLDS
ncbi:tyrosine-type recombinase/integrase [Endozoicomonas ascidiicola]|uniref:tyrosine-type recombinase/integrase n=1 Tax=Endozoicomonas ascidiicola TaxID=1698521 RepID=UPI00082F0B73|nr:site-specific integrase [Endozoicomonas ascidiicola]